MVCSAAMWLRCCVYFRLLLLVGLVVGFVGLVFSVDFVFLLWCLVWFCSFILIVLLPSGITALVLVVVG